MKDVSAMVMHARVLKEEHDAMVFCRTAPFQEILCTDIRLKMISLLSDIGSNNTEQYRFVMAMINDARRDCNHVHACRIERSSGRSEQAD